MLQEVMQNHSINVVEEAVQDPSQQGPLTPAGTHLLLLHNKRRFLKV